MNENLSTQYFLFFYDLIHCLFEYKHTHTHAHIHKNRQTRKNKKKKIFYKWNWDVQQTKTKVYKNLISFSTFFLSRFFAFFAWFLCHFVNCATTIFSIFVWLVTINTFSFLFYPFSFGLFDFPSVLFLSASGFVTILVSVDVFFFLVLLLFCLFQCVCTLCFSLTSISFDQRHVLISIVMQRCTHSNRMNIVLLLYFSLCYY